MLRLGSSKPWPEALYQMTGTRNMDVGPLLEYFQPLVDWLKMQNAGHPTGWDEECPQHDVVQAGKWLQEYDEQVQIKKTKSTFADWGYTSNITDENSAKSVQFSKTRQVQVFERLISTNMRVLRIRIRIRCTLCKSKLVSDLADTHVTLRLCQVPP